MKKKLLIALGALILIGAGGYLFLKKDSQAFTYKEIKVKKSNIVIKIQSSGTVSPQNRLEIKPPVAGRIEEVLVAEGEVVKRGKNLAWISSTERAALMDAARSKGDAELARWEKLYRPTPVIAPIDGTIILRNVESGQSFTSADSIFTMADRLAVKAKVDETDIAQVKKSQKTLITLDAYPNDPVNGVVTHVAYDAVVTNNVTTYDVTIIPDSVPDFMRSGMTANISIEVLRKDDVLAIPLSTVTTTPEGSFVEVKNAGKIVKTPIELGLEDGRLVEVVSGILEGEILVIKEMNSQSSPSKNARSPFMPSGPGRGGRR